MLDQNQTQNPLLEGNQGNPNPNGERSALGATIVGMIGLAFLIGLVWYVSTHEASDEEQEVKRRITSEPNNHANLLFMAAVPVMAFSAYEVVNRLVSQSSLFHTRQKLPNTTKKNKSNEQGPTPSTHKV